MATTISVIIPTYAPENYLWECLDSLERQTLQKDKFEVILVLNGEREPFEDMIVQKLLDYSFASSLLYSSPHGVSMARNLGLDYAKGRYICFIDDDDWVSDNFLEELLRKVCASSIVEANVIEVDEENNRKESERHFLSRAYKKYQPSKAASCYANRSFFSSACCKLIPVECIDGQRFDIHVKRGEDSIFMYAISWKVKQIKTTVPNCIYYVRKRHRSASRDNTSTATRLYEFLAQTAKYTSLYVRHMPHNAPLFFLSRIAGTFYHKFIQQR